MKTTSVISAKEAPFRKGFLKSKIKEHQLVCALVTNSITMQDFVNSSEIVTDNCKLIKNVVQQLIDENNPNLPDQIIFV